MARPENRSDARSLNLTLPEETFNYLVLLATALLRGEAARSLQAVVALAAAVFGGYLLYVQVEVIEAVCQWCLASDAIITGIAMLALLRIKVAQESPAPPSSSPSASA